MDHRNPASLTLVALVLFLTAGWGAAAEFSPAVEYQIKQAAPGEFVSAIIILESPLDIRALDQRLHEERAPLARRHREVIAALKYNASDTQPEFLSELDEAKARGEVRGYTSYWIENLIVVSAQPDFLESLRDRSDIRYVTENFRAELIEPVGTRTPEETDETRPPRHTLDEQTTPGQRAIGATRVNHELGITGAGVLVANLDTGVDGDHPALASRWRGNVAPASECWLDVLSTSDFPWDADAHGTHVMGSITGREILPDDTITVGSAPDALWIACNAIGQGAGGDFNNDVIDAFQWFIDPDGNPETLDDMPDVVQNSWGVHGGFPGYVTCFDEWNTVILNLEAAGTVVTWSAGNESTSGLRAPAIFEFNPTQIFSVGAVTVQEGDDPPYDIAGFSSQGPSPCLAGGIKPEVVAPGVDVYSSVPGGGYESSGWSGTSMAGPHVAGAVALMREACPDCDPTTIKEALMNTAIDHGQQGDDNVFGMGFIDAYAAVLEVSTLGEVSGTITDESAQPLPGVRVVVEEADRMTYSGADGRYNLRLSDGVYTMHYSMFGYMEQTLNGVTVAQDSTTIRNLTMVAVPSAELSGRVYSAYGEEVAGAEVSLPGYPVEPVVTNLNGEYSFVIPTSNEYIVQAAKSDQGGTRASLLLHSDAVLNLYFSQPFLCCDFESDQSWSAGDVDDGAERGIWSRMDPEGTTNYGRPVQPEDDHTANPGALCWVTEGNEGGNVGAGDVDGGKTTLFSPIWNLTDHEFVALEIWSWFSNDEGNAPGDDPLQIDVSDDAGATWTTMLNSFDNWEYWKHDLFFLEDYIELTDQVRLRVIARDDSPGSLVEAAIDDVCLYAGSAVTPPTEVTALREGDHVVLRWRPVPAASDYRVWWSLHYPVVFSSATIIGQTGDTSFVDTDVLPWDSGYYVITAHP